MKSKRAIEHIIKKWWHDKQIINVSDAEHAVELAEEDARERAIEAFKRYITKNSISSILPSDKMLMDIAISEFKEKYDNENRKNDPGVGGRELPAGLRRTI